MPVQARPMDLIKTIFVTTHTIMLHKRNRKVVGAIEDERGSSRENGRTDRKGGDNCTNSSCPITSIDMQLFIQYVVAHCV